MENYILVYVVKHVVLHIDVLHMVGILMEEFHPKKNIDGGVLAWIGFVVYMSRFQTNENNTTIMSFILFYFL